MTKLRGRPPEIIEPPKKYTRTFIDKDGEKSIWYYDEIISKRGPYKVEIFPSKEQIKEEKKKVKIPKTKQKYFNSKNGKYVGYQRAKALNLIK